MANERDKAASVGVGETRIARIELPPEGLRLDGGAALPELNVAYETYGVLSPRRDNVVYLCHALTGDAHAAGWHECEGNAPGWWDDMIGPGKGIDTNIYFVVCGNILGGCKGTTGPSSLDPATGKPYGTDFPAITVGDLVTVHRLLLRHLGVERVAGLIGGSLGGMQVIEWMVRHPESVDRAVCIASATSLSAQALAFDIVARRAITSDPDWQGGRYYGTGRRPDRGLALARRIGHITYLSPAMMTSKFGRERRERPAGSAAAPDFSSDFQVESYLDYQGEKFLKRFDANSYLYITQAMDEYDLATGRGTVEEALRVVKAKVLVIALSDDWLFPPEQSVALAGDLLRSGRQVSFCRLHAPHGHDAFLVDIEHLSEVVRAFMPWVRRNGEESAAAVGSGAEDGVSDEPRPRPRHGVRQPPDVEECDRLLSMIEPGSRVLDLGCGDGRLLSLLKARRGIRGVGVDISIESVIDVLDAGHDILQGDIDAGLATIPAGSYDYAILSETLQVVRKPRFVLGEMLRVARYGIVSFPNFAKWSLRLQLGLRGRMPKGKSLPFEWYDTPNIHLFTLKDFGALCREDGIRILQVHCVPDSPIGALLVRMQCCNLGADRVLVKIAREET